MIDIEINFYEVKKRSPDRNRGRLPKLTAYEKKFILNLLFLFKLCKSNATKLTRC